MKMKKMSQESIGVPRDEHEQLEQENFAWLGAMREALSPYWSARFEYQRTSKMPVLVIPRLTAKAGRVS